ncbi:related to PRP3-essential splicing factor [Sporisorium reilianum f. sp. reilianum]|uniref:Related to PRP3-essential splicing factor n=1 Tax=Sporisorium reilianum f. sp. reilianum TaxID=72559 RepID=A0A2N8UGY7_9BASI|nr:related to PRP3-essential splicing factor [Sporisorium reilianum f. sp. reilianum]
MPPKRPIRNVFGADDDDPSSVDETQNGTPPKKIRTDSRSTSTIHRVGVPPPTTQHASAVQQNGGAPGGNTSIQAQVAAAKARAQALMNALQSKGSAAPGGSGAPATASLTSRFAPMGNGGAATSAVPSSSTVSAPSSVAARPPAAGGSSSNSSSSSIQAQLEAARAKVQAQMAALNNKNKMPSATSAPHPRTSSIAAAPTTSSFTASTSASTSSSKAPTGIHPLLLSNNLPYKPTPSNSSLKATSTSTSSPFIKGRTHAAPESNPYLQASRELAAETSAEGPKQRSMHKGFQFHKPGRHVREAEELRREQQMEALKRRIEESARKAGLQDELGGDEKRLLRSAPPEVEWWDVNLLSQQSYERVPDSSTAEEMLKQAQGQDPSVLLFGEASPIDQYIQHPIPIPAPSTNAAVQPRGLMLTRREQRKLRRQRRAAEQQDKRDRIKMGLLPPEPPKVKLSNLMRVLTSEAVSDPTKIEARVRREIAARKEAHERMNAERRLTREQRRDKVERKKQADADKGVFCHVYRVQHLVSARHKFKVQRNALDHGLTGVTVFHPSMALVVVEGSAKALKAYKRLMTVRIDWTDPGAPNASDNDKPDEQSANNTPLTGFRHLTTRTDNVDWAANTCELIFEGPIRQRYWAERGFRAKAAPTDQAAREALGEQMQGYWDVAKRAGQSQADAF